jgi:hypothetical protein
MPFVALDGAGSGKLPTATPSYSVNRKEKQEQL